jgi:hypothetical protein
MVVPTTSTNGDRITPATKAKPASKRGKRKAVKRPADLAAMRDRMHELCVLMGVDIALSESIDTGDAGNEIYEKLGKTAREYVRAAHGI